MCNADEFQVVFKVSTTTQKGVGWCPKDLVQFVCSSQHQWSHRGTMVKPLVSEWNTQEIATFLCELSASLSTPTRVHLSVDSLASFYRRAMPSSYCNLKAHAILYKEVYRLELKSTNWQSDFEEESKNRRVTNCLRLLAHTHLTPRDADGYLVLKAEDVIGVLSIFGHDHEKAALFLQLVDTAMANLELARLVQHFSQKGFDPTKASKFLDAVDIAETKS